MRSFCCLLFTPSLARFKDGAQNTGLNKNQNIICGLLQIVAESVTMSPEPKIKFRTS
jgi:hypothetical protein